MVLGTPQKKSGKSKEKTCYCIGAIPIDQEKIEQKHKPVEKIWIICMSLSLYVRLGKPDNPIINFREKNAPHSIPEKFEKT